MWARGDDSTSTTEGRGLWTTVGIICSFAANDCILNMQDRGCKTDRLSDISLQTEKSLCYNTCATTPVLQYLCYNTCATIPVLQYLCYNTIKVLWSHTAKAWCHSETVWCDSKTYWSSQSRRWLRFQFQGCTVLNLYRTDPYYMTLQKQMKHAYAKPYMQVQLEGKKRKGKESLPHWSSLNVVKSLAWNCQLDAQFNMHAHNSYLSVQA